MESFLNIQNLRYARRWRLCVSAWLSVSLIFLSISTPLHAQPAPDSVGQPVPVPAGEESVSAKRDATIGDVAVCTMLAEGVAILIWHLPAAIRALGTRATAANTKLVTILGGDKNLVTGIEMIAAAIRLKIMPKNWMEMTLQEFFNHVIKPAWDSCKRVGADLGTLTIPPTTSELLTKMQLIFLDIGFCRT